METSLDFLSSVLDEIALEGLDGITLPTLWLRLEERPHFPLALDENSKAFLWECVAVCKDIEIYQLPAPRATIVPFNLFALVDPEVGILLEPSSRPEDIYPIEAVEDDNVRGSCATYKTRVCITSLVRHGSVLLTSLNQVSQKWGDTLVLVCSPKLRLLSLIGTEINPLFEVRKEQYCLLERIGRSRFHGELTQGECGLASHKAVFKEFLHYHAKKLSDKGLITKQKYSLRRTDGKISSGCLFHLTRFYVQRKNKYDTLMECLSSILKEKPNNRETSKRLLKEMGVQENVFKKLLQRSSSAKWFKIDQLRYKEMFPESSEKEYTSSNGQEKEVKVIQLIRPYGEDEFSDDEKADNMLYAHFDPTKLLIDRPLICQVYKIIENEGLNGITLANIQRILTIPKLEVRQICRQLHKRNEVVTVMQDKGRQRFEKYFAKKYAKQNEPCVSLETQKPIGNHDQKSMVESASPLKDDALQHVNASKETEGATPLNESTTVKGTNTFNKSDGETKANILKSLPGTTSEESNSQISAEVIVVNCKDIDNTEKTLQYIPSFVCNLSSGNATKTLNQNQILSHRLVKRTNIIIDHLKCVKLAPIYEFSKIIYLEEQKEGYNFRIDRRSTARILSRLFKEQRINVLKVVLHSCQKKKEIEFVCDPSVQTGDVEVKMAIDKAKFKNFSTCNDQEKIERNSKDLSKADVATKVKTAGPKAVKSLDTETSRKLKKPKLSEEKNSDNKSAKIFSPLFGRKVCGVLPKFVRSKALHLFLFYLVHEYEGEGTPGDDSDAPFVYHSSMSWKRYVPPLPDYKRNGWCIIGDVIYRMPLCIFVKLVNLRYEIPGLSVLLEDEEKKNYLLKHLPQGLRKDLLCKRRYIFQICDILSRLCYMGLVSFGPRMHLEKDQIYVFIRQHALIKDTTTTPPSYVHIDRNTVYQTNEFHLKTLNDVESYWNDLETTCLCTHLGRYSIAVPGQSFILEGPSQNEKLIAALKSKSFEEIEDVGEIPGDGLGAAGLDSSLFAHLRRNWYWSSLVVKLPVIAQRSKNDGTKENAKPLQHLLQKEAGKGCSSTSRERLQRLTKRVLLPSVKVSDKDSRFEGAPSAKKIRVEKVRMKGVRTVKKRSQKIRRPYYDAKDKEAMENLNKMRTDWTPQEDSFLLLCKVASSFLDPKFKSLVVPHTVVRDLLHEKFPHTSYDKTSRACQRRLRHMLLKSEETRNNIAVFLGEAMEDSDLVQEFERSKPPKTKEKEWRNMFTALLDKLLKKFSMSPSDRCKLFSLPKTASEFDELYTVNFPITVLKLHMSHSEPVSVLDIHQSVLSVIVLSSLASVSEKQNWSRTLYHIYNQYSEELLKGVIQKLCKDHLIVKKKPFTCVKSQSSPIPSVPYRFSITYENSLLTKYPLKIHAGATELLGKLQVGQSDGMYNKTLLEGDVPAGYVAAMLSLVLTKKLRITTEIPDQIIIFNTFLNEKQRSSILENIAPSLTDKESQELAQLLKSSSEPSKSADMGGHSASSQKSSRASRKPKRRKISNSAYKDDEVYASEAEPFSSGSSSFGLTTNKEFNPTAASRLALYMLRQESSQPKVNRVQHTQDYIAVNPCLLSCEIEFDESCSFSIPLNPKDVMEGKVQCSYDVFKENLLDEKVSRDIVSAQMSYIPKTLMEKNYTDLDLAFSNYPASVATEGAQYIMKEVLLTEELGIIHKDLWCHYRNVYGNDMFVDDLNLLINNSLVLRVGIASFRYVGIMHSRSWLSPSCSVPEKPRQSVIGTEGDEVGIFSDTRHDQEPSASSHRQELVVESQQIKASDASFGDILFLPRSWKKPDGTLNPEVFVRFLKTVLCHIMNSPGITEEKVCERFTVALQPVQCLELVEVLEKINCVFKYYRKAAKKSSLFSPTNTLCITHSPEPEDTVHYESLADAVVKMEKFTKFVMSWSEDNDKY